jgi:hypothetical protein
MQDTSCGKFCNSCQKEVYDFTRLSDNEVYKILQANKGKVCAQLTNEQLQNGFTYTEETYNNTAWLKYAASILFIGGITNAFSQTAVWEFKTTKTELQDKTTSKSISKDSIYIQGSIINAVTNKPLTYPMLVEIQSENKTLTQTISSDTGSFNLLISNKENVDKINVILHYQNSKNDTIQVPKEHVSFEKLENELHLIVRTAVNSEILKVKYPNRNSRENNYLGVVGIRSTDANSSVFIDGVKMRGESNKLNNFQIIQSGTPANLESKPLDNNQNR